MEPSILLIVVGCFALLIIVGTAIAVLRILRQPDTGATKPALSSAGAVTSEGLGDAPASMTETLPTTPTEDINTYLEEKQANLSPFELKDLSNSFKGITQGGDRSGILLHIGDSDTGLVAFTSQAFSPQNGIVKAETTYGKMELIITQGRAGVKWQDEPLGILDYTNQRILGPEGQLLGSMERPPLGSESGYYPVGFFGQKVADVITRINALSTLRWFGDEGSEQLPAFDNLVNDLEDNQTLLLLAALLLEVGFMNLLGELNR